MQLSSYSFCPTDHSIYSLEVDMLENVEIGEQRRRDNAYKAAKQKSGYEDK